jgi:hypothetical protein
MTWIFLNHIHANYQCCIEVNFYFYLVSPILLFCVYCFILFALLGLGWHVFALEGGKNVKLQTPNNLCLHKCMILPMKMMTMMMPLKKQFTSSNIHQCDDIWIKAFKWYECICKLLPLFHLYGCWYVFCYI